MNRIKFSLNFFKKAPLDTSLIYVCESNADNPYYRFVVKILETDGRYVKYLSGNKESKTWASEDDYQTLPYKYFQDWYVPAKNQEKF